MEDKSLTSREKYMCICIFIMIIIAAVLTITCVPILLAGPGNTTIH